MKRKWPDLKSVPSCDPAFEIQPSYSEHCVYLKMTGLTVHVTADLGGSGMSEPTPAAGVTAQQGGAGQ